MTAGRADKMVGASQLPGGVVEAFSMSMRHLARFFGGLSI